MVPINKDGSAGTVEPIVTGFLQPDNNYVGRPVDVMVMKDGSLVHDFLFLNTDRMLHVCNAPSPAATSAIPIGEMIARRSIGIADAVPQPAAPQPAAPQS